jgi:hypothetical protein
MKTRTGFVSNSSTTSFTIFGTCLEDESREVFNIPEDDDDPDATIEEMLKKVGLDFESGFEAENQYVGINAENLPMDKTLAELKVEIKEKLEKIGIKTKVIKWYSESWRDG